MQLIKGNWFWFCQISVL